MKIVRYILELDSNDEVEGLARILQTETQLWGEYYAGHGVWKESEYVIASYIREPGNGEFFHDEERAKEIMTLIDNMS
jgi:hypothetical protein